MAAHKFLGGWMQDGTLQMIREEPRGKPELARMCKRVQQQIGGAVVWLDLTTRLVQTANPHVFGYPEKLMSHPGIAATARAMLKFIDGTSHQPDVDPVYGDGTVLKAMP